MESKPFAVVDVFATTPYKGNPLAVVENMSDDLSATQMKLIARQFNLSETTFLSRPTTPKADYRLRSFLPDGTEVLGVGHNILGAWWYLAHAGFLNLSTPLSVDEQTGTENFAFHQELGTAVMPVNVSRHKSSTGGSISELTISIRQARPESHNIHPDPAALAAAVGLSAQDVELSSLPPQVMSTATTRHLIVPVSSVEALNRAVVYRNQLLDQLKLVDDKAYGLFLFTPVMGDTAQGVPAFEARFFSPGMSKEDPATGSAAGPLAAYLHRHGQLNLDAGSARIQVRQGLMVGRDCLIDVVVSHGGADGKVDVDVIAVGVQVANGQISVPDRYTEF
jgi:PhzF family phenazine biosynthesis protein